MEASIIDHYYLQVVGQVIAIPLVILNSFTDCHSSGLSAQIVGIGLSDMYFLRLRVRQSWSFSLSDGFLLSKLGLLYLTFPSYHCSINRPDMQFCSHLFSLVFHIVPFDFFSAADILVRCCFTV